MHYVQCQSDTIACDDPRVVLITIAQENKDTWFALTHIVMRVRQLQWIGTGHPKTRKYAVCLHTLPQLMGLKKDLSPTRIMTSRHLL